MFDDLQKLHDNTDAVTSSANGKDADGDAIAINVGSGLVKGQVEIDVDTLNLFSGTKDQKVVFHLVGGSDASFTQSVSLASLEIGNRGALVGNIDSKEGRYLMPFQNAQRGTIFPYLRIRAVVSGTGTSVKYLARLSQDLPVPGVTSLTQSGTATTTTTV